MTGEERERFDELVDTVYHIDDPTSLPDAKLAELWRLNYKREESMTRGQEEIENCKRSMSIVINSLDGFNESSRKIAKTKLNQHRIKCLKLADRFAEINDELRVLFNTFIQVSGFSKGWRRR